MVLRATLLHFALALMVLALASKADQPSARHVSFVREIYHELGENDGNITLTAEKFQDEFHTLDHDGRLRETLESLVEFRIEDLLLALEHAHRLREVIEAFNPPQ